MINMGKGMLKCVFHDRLQQEPQNLMVLDSVRNLEEDLHFTDHAQVHNPAVVGDKCDLFRYGYIIVGALHAVCQNIGEGTDGVSERISLLHGSHPFQSAERIIDKVRRDLILQGVDLQFALFIFLFIDTMYQSIDVIEHLLNHLIDFPYFTGACLESNVQIAIGNRLQIVLHMSDRFCKGRDDDT